MSETPKETISVTQSPTEFQDSETEEDLYIDPAAEARVVRKLDTRVLPILCLFYFLAALDRSNLGNAGPAGLTKALDLTASQFSNAVTLFFVTYIVFELPGTLLLKILRPSRVLTFSVVCWSLVCIGTTFVSSYASLVVCRVLLGMFESWFFPCLSVIVSSMIYKREEVAIRMAILLSMAALSGCVGGLISYGFLQVNTSSLEGFRFIFLLEGLITFVLSPIIYIFYPDDPVHAKFFNEEESKIMAIRAKQREKFMGSQKFEWKEVGMAFKEVRTYYSMIIQFCGDTILFGFSTFLPSILKKGLGFANLEAQYMTIPVYFFSALAVISISWWSDRISSRGRFIFATNLFGIVGYIILLASSNNASKYFACYLIAIPLYIGPGINITWTSSNTAPLYRRNTAIGCNQTIGNLSGAIAGQVYRTAPYYLGNGFSLGCLVVANICVILNTLRLRSLIKEKKQILNNEKVDTRKVRTGDYELEYEYVL